MINFGIVATTIRNMDKVKRFKVGNAPDISAKLLDFHGKGTTVSKFITHEKCRKIYSDVK